MMTSASSFSTLPRILLGLTDVDVSKWHGIFHKPNRTTLESLYPQQLLLKEWHSGVFLFQYYRQDHLDLQIHSL